MYIVNMNSSTISTDFICLIKIICLPMSGTGRKYKQ